MFTVYNDISSIQFENNLIGKIIETGIPKGFEKVVFELVTNKQSLLIPVSDKSPLKSQGTDNQDLGIISNN